ncbi:MAG: hypothetical protein H6554_11520, partial [Chitinophagales bacterium]|nr:hypothetical protein [Chitinophagales bacterium]
TYNLYEQNKYEQVLSRRQEAKTLFASSDLQPQFDLLAAFAIGSLQGREPYISALESIVKDYPSGDVNQRAKEILSYLKKNSNTSFIEDPNANIYKENFDTEHYLVATIVDKNDQSVISTALSDFSGTNFPDENLKTTSMLLDPQTPIIVVKTFRSGENAMNYYTECKAQKENIFRDIPSKKYKLFVISKENFAVFFKDKNADTYQNFFKQYYETK